MAQYNRLWIPVYDRLRALVDEHVPHEGTSEAKLLQLKAATETALEQAIQGRSGAEMELMMEVGKIVTRPGITWERVQELTERTV